MTGFASSFFPLPSSFLCLLKCLSQPISFLTFVSPILSLTLLGIRSDQEAVCCLAAGQGQSTTNYIGGFLIVFTSNKPFLTI